MKIKKATFLQSVTDFRKCPPANKPEYAFIGRSNVGKSSLLNMLVGQANLARTSQSPGKTQTINHYLINEHWYMSDLPGYGFAKVSQVMRKSWHIMIESYLKNRTNLLCTFLLVDIRLAPQKNDLQFMQWLATNGVAFVIVFTKADKLSAPKIKSSLETYEEELSKTWEETPYYFVSSAMQQTGKEEILEYISNLNQEFGAAVQEAFKEEDA
jgi:GTP-binding protein